MKIPDGDLSFLRENFWHGISSLHSPSLIPLSPRRDPFSIIQRQTSVNHIPFRDWIPAKWNFSSRRTRYCNPGFPNGTAIFFYGWFRLCLTEIIRQNSASHSRFAPRNGRISRSNTAESRREIDAKFHARWQANSLSIRVSEYRSAGHSQWIRR